MVDFDVVRKQTRCVAVVHHHFRELVAVVREPVDGCRVVLAAVLDVKPVAVLVPLLVDQVEVGVVLKGLVLRLHRDQLGSVLGAVDGVLRERLEDAWFAIARNGFNLFC